MTAITDPRDTPWRDCILVPLPVAKGEVIPMGAIVCVSATGFAVNGKEDATLKYAGCADESVDNSAGEDGAQLINVRANKAFKWASDGTITQASLLTRAYIVDSSPACAWCFPVSLTAKRMTRPAATSSSPVASACL